MAILDALGAILGQSRARLGSSSAIVRPLGAILGLSWLPWRSLGAILDPLGPFLAHLGPSWGHLGSVLAHLGPSWGHIGRSCGPLGVLLGPSWNLPSWAILAPSGASFMHLGAMRGHEPESPRKLTRSAVINSNNARQHTS